MARHSSPGGIRHGRFPQWFIVLIFVGVVGISWWETRNQRGALPQTRDSQSTPGNRTSEYAHDDLPAIRPIDVQVADETPATSHPDVAIIPMQDGSAGSARPGASSSRAKEKSKSTRIENQTIHDQTGHVVFQGTIDLQPTLDRIARGVRNSHRNDGSTFQNRERRLPLKPKGYYREYVHPTPNTGGPGPQRVIIGQDGDVWYTPDHYNTFRRIQTE